MRTLWIGIAIASALAAGVGCKKETSGKDPADDVTPAGPAGAGDPAAAGDTAAAGQPPAAAGAASDTPEAPDRDPIEEGLDMTWAEETDGCKENRDDKDRAFEAKYKELCTPALTRVAACHGKADFVTKVSDAQGLGDKDTRRALKEQVGTAKKITTTCASLAHEQLCNFQGRSWFEPYRASQLRAMLATPDGDCAALAEVYPGVLQETGE
jgi:hypothetical protein